MPVPARTRRVALIDQMAAEWRSVGRSAEAVTSLRTAARRDDALRVLVCGSDEGAALCPTPCDLLDHMRKASGRNERAEAARLLRVLLREATDDPFLCRLVVQALVPGLITVARKLEWGRGGDWDDGEAFFGELVSTTWLVVLEWSGQDRPYAVLDLLSAIRCRLRRQLFRSKETGERSVPIDRVSREHLEARASTDLEDLARTLIELRQDGMALEEVQVLYAHHVLGYSLAELASMTGRKRRALYARRDRGRRRLGTTMVQPP